MLPIALFSFGEIVRSKMHQEICSMAQTLLYAIGSGGKRIDRVRQFLLGIVEAHNSYQRIQSFILLRKS
jgi:hypothetical protein